MSIEAAFPLTPSIYFISYGKIVFDLFTFHLHAYFQECICHVHREVAVIFIQQQCQLYLLGKV
jgi:hypothetical protein